MVTSLEFWDRVAPKYAKDPIKDMDAYERTLDRVRSYLKPSDEVLEIGAGTGMTATKLSPSVKSMVSTDISPKMMEIARSRLEGGRTPNLTFEVGTAFEGPHLGRQYDAVLAFNFIHLADDPQAMINAAFDLVRPGGVFISKSACLGDWYRVMKLMIGAMKLVGKAPHVAWFSRAQLDQMMRNAGFDIVETHDFSLSPPSHFVVARRP